jgi:hypothetical protein
MFALLGICQWLAAFTGLAPVYLIKLMLMLFLLASATMVYRWSGRDISLTALFYFPALHSALALSYVDILFVPPLLWALYSLQRGQVSFFAAGFTLACCIKFIPLLIAPFLALYVWRLYYQQYGVLRAVLCLQRHAVLPAVLVLIPVVFWFGEPLLHALQRSLGQAWLSAQGLNFNWVITRLLVVMEWARARPMDANPYLAMIDPAPDVFLQLAKGLFACFYGSVLIRFLLRPLSLEQVLLACLLGSFAYFTFNPGVHESHLFLTGLLGVALCVVHRKYLSVVIGIQLASSLNLFLFYGTHGGTPGMLYHSEAVAAGYRTWFDIYLMMALFNTAYFLWLWYHFMAKGSNAHTATA